MNPILQFHAPLHHELTPGLQSIEVSLSLQLPSFQIVGLASKEIAESRERIRAAIQSCGIEFPRRRVVINLAPADVRKRGTGVDLPIALALMATDRETEIGGDPQSYLAWGELGLDGRLRSAGFILRALYAAQCFGVDAVILTEEDRGPSLEVETFLKACSTPSSRFPQIFWASNLVEAWMILKSRQSGVDQEPALTHPPFHTIKKIRPERRDHEHPEINPPHARVARVLGVAAAGDHHLIALGPRGTGKSTALEWLAQIRPKPSNEDRLTSALTAELGGPFKFESARSSLDQRQIVRRVSQPSSSTALTGGLSTQGLRPGEFSAAHGGLLIADEFPEWPRDCREALREPLEAGKIRLTRALGSTELPARFTLAASGNLCPCGGWKLDQSPAQSCRCSASDRARYLDRLSGPLLDRIDICLQFSSPPTGSVASKAESKVESARERVEATRLQMVERFGCPTGRISAVQIEPYAAQSPFNLASGGSLRGRHKIARIALGLAVWDGLDAPSPLHWTEAQALRWAGLPRRFN